MPETYTFWGLHVAIQDSMGWLDYHLHLFRVSDPVTGGLVQVGIPDDDAFEGNQPILPGWEVPIATYLSRPGAVTQYEYDFGDGWEHEVVLEALAPWRQGTRYPVCLTGGRACPPEDCGGVGGYEELLAVISNPAHEEYESTLQWLGGRFEPEKFEPARVKFDDPGRRWRVAFEQAGVSGRRVDRLARGLANDRLQRTRARRAAGRPKPRRRARR